MPFRWIPRVTDLLPGAIKGLWTIGDTSSWHVEIGTNPAGDSGIRLYGADGVTKAIDLDVSGGLPSITGALIRTAATGRRIEMSSAQQDTVLFWGDLGPGESPGIISVDSIYGAGLQRGELVIESPGVTPRAAVLLHSESADASVPAAAIVRPDTSTLRDWTFTDEQLQDPDGHPYPKWAGTTQRTIDAASVTITTDAAGNASVPVNFTGTPLVVIAQFGLSGTAVIVETGSYVAGGFGVRLKTDTGAALATTGTLHYIAIGP